jgi:FtsZ-interacting cell division protein YlmF
MPPKKQTKKYSSKVREGLDTDGKEYLKDLNKLQKPYLEKYAHVVVVNWSEDMNMEAIRDCILEDYENVCEEDKNVMWEKLKEEVERQKKEKKRQKDETKDETKNGKTRVIRTPGSSSSKIVIAETVRKTFATTVEDLIKNLQAVL